MKKTLVALATIGASCAALAQSSVTIFGVVDTRVGYGTGSVAHKSQLASSGTSANRFGFRGVEDLGGDMSASFHLEAGVATQSGSGAATDPNNQGTSVGGLQGLTFNRRSTVSLSGKNFGELRLGRDVTPQLWNQATFDPLGFVGVGVSQISINIGGPTNVRASNSIGYFLPPDLGGWYGQAMYHLGNNASDAKNPKDGNGGGIRVGFARGPWNVAFATSHTLYAAGNINTTNVGGSYNFGIAQVMAVYNRDEVAGVRDAHGWLVGAMAPVGVGQIKVSYSSYKGTLASADRRTDKLSLGYVYNLSKLTAAYATVAHLNNKNGAAQALNGGITSANRGSSGYDVGLRVSF